MKLEQLTTTIASYQVYRPAVAIQGDEAEHTLLFDAETSDGHLLGFRLTMTPAELKLLAQELNLCPARAKLSIV